MGILPKYLWEDTLSGGFSLSIYNIEPIGSGPYKVRKIRRDSTNIPISYELRSFDEYALGKPFLKNIIFHFVKNDSELLEMFNNGVIDSMSGISPAITKEIVNTSAKIIAIPLPRIFGIFFNQNESQILADDSVREALDASAPKNEIINDILYGFAEPANDPIPPHLEVEEIENTPNTSSLESRIKAGKIILENAGWVKDENGFYVLETETSNKILSFTVLTSNVPELVLVAEKVVESWRAMGADVSLKTFEGSDLNQTVIRPRNFEALLFGIVVDSDSDLYAFWHSSNRLDPGLNITGYANIATDGLLEDLRGVLSPETRLSTLSQFTNEIEKDQPAIFLYTPKFIYIVPEKIEGVQINNIKSTEDRFMNVHEWYVEVDKIWKIFN